MPTLVFYDAHIHNLCRFNLTNLIKLNRLNSPDGIDLGTVGDNLIQIENAVSILSKYTV